MPDASIVIKATDRYSDAINSMRRASQNFTRDAEGLQAKLAALDKTKASLKVETDAAKRKLAEAERQFQATGDAASLANLQAARADYENARRNLDLVTRSARDAEQQLRRLDDTLNGGGRGGNGGGSGSGQNNGMLGTLNALVKSGLGNQLGQALSGAAGTVIGSALSDEAGGLVSSLASGIAAGAAMGSIAGPAGAAIGAAVGGVSGLVSGAAQAGQARDEAFKAYYGDLYDTLAAASEERISTGSELAAQRQTNRISFKTLLGGQDVADEYLSSLVDMANTTPFLYDDLVRMSKTLATYGYGADEILPKLQTVGDTGAALGMTTSDMSMVATAIGRMDSTNKTTLEYLNLLQERGIDAIGALASAFGTDKGGIYDMISKSQIAGSDAASIILADLAERFGGAMAEQSQTFSGLSSTLEGLQQEVANAAGEGYNEERGQGIRQEIEALTGPLGEALKTLEAVSGENKAFLENLKEQYQREALGAVLAGQETTLYDDTERASLEALGEEYRKASEEYAAGNREAGLKMESLRDQAEALATAAYDSSEQAQLLQETELDLVGAIRDSITATDNLAGAMSSFRMEQERSRGMAAGLFGAGGIASTALDAVNNGTGFSYGGYYFDPAQMKPHAAGLDRVPYDNYPALLHEGERVLTANQARNEDQRGAPGVMISGNQFTVREEADIDRIAAALVEQLSLACSFS